MSRKIINVLQRIGIAIGIIAIIILTIINMGNWI